MKKVIKILRKIARELLLKWRQEDRYFIERRIFPKIKHKKVLLVGVANYTENYPFRLRKNSLWSIDIDPSVAKYGAKNHIVGNIKDIDSFFNKDFFDIILMFGVFGYGLNDPKEADKTLKNCAKVLNKKGQLFIQWSDMPGHNQVNPQELDNYKLFKDSVFYGFKSPFRVKKKTKVFHFLVKN
ncbi:MAG: methyltransferase domain-containing protein [Nanoarchaeota archaeon]|nr:class I SAM-dependent methyltransferase [Nanoarchaeota archaeon]MBU2475136.1 class I SAM-dependent methyltransferase [Nanoarchaeota archaeon]